MNCGHTGKFFYHNCPDDPAQACPGVHALVIGTSDYRSAKGEAKQIFGDLPGTSIAAARFATWLVKDFRDPKSIPLRTVRVLLSPMPSEAEGLPQGHAWGPDTQATQLNVLTALQRWRNACNSRSGNVAILYVGGHGTVTTDSAQHVFLREANMYDDRYVMSISVSVIRAAMATCRAKSNVYIIDCCALPEKSMPDFIRSGGIGISAFEADNEGPKRAYHFTITAARVGTETYALGSKDGTLLSWALMPLLKKAGKLIEEYFTVTMGKISSQLLAAIRERRGIQLPEGWEPVVIGDDDPAGFTRPQPPPCFAITFVPIPGATERTVTVTVKDGTTGEAIAQRQVNGGDSEPVKLRAGNYPAVAKFRAENGEEKSEPYRFIVEHDARLFSHTGSEAS